MITPRFGFTARFVKEWNNRVYCRLSKMRCESKDQVRARPSGETCGLVILLQPNPARVNDGGQTVVVRESTQLWIRQLKTPQEECLTGFVREGCIAIIARLHSQLGDLFAPA